MSNHSTSSFMYWHIDYLPRMSLYLLQDITTSPDTLNILRQLPFRDATANSFCHVITLEL
jgi:hypothetical protein